MKRVIGLFCLVTTLHTATGLAAATDLVKLANPLQGTDSMHGFSHGNTFPAIVWLLPLN